MKNLVSLFAVLSVCAVGLTSGNAVGGSVAVGSDCHVYNFQFSEPPPYQRHTNALSHGLYTDDAQLLGVTCALPTENTLGTTVNFRARVFDNSETNSVTCVGTVYNSSGSSIASTSELTTSASGVTTTTLSGSLTLAAQSSSYTYAINCTLPGDQSAIHAVRVF